MDDCPSPFDVTALSKLPEPAKTINITGAVTPDINGAWTQTGIYNNEPYFELGVSGCVLWTHEEYEAKTWFITPEVGNLDTIYWYNDNSDIEVEFTPEPPAEGMVSIAKLDW